VLRQPPAVTAVHPSAAEVGSTVPLIISGSNLTGAALVITTPSGGSVGDVTIAGVATPDDSTLTATLVIAPTAVASGAQPRRLIVTTESGQTTTDFFVVPAGGNPTVTGIAPAAGERGQSVQVTFHGLHLTGGGVTAAFPFTVGTQAVIDDETIVAQVSVDSSAALNANFTLTITTGGGMANASFRVIPTGSPFIGAVRPPFGNRGSSFTMIVSGVNLTQIVPGTGVDVLDPSNKIHESGAAAVDDQTVRATIAIDPTANIGSRNVKVTTNTGSFTTTSSPFQVNNPGQLPTITDVLPHLIEPGATTPMSVSGSNFGGGSVLVTGPDAIVSNTTVNGAGTGITFDLTLAADAPDETRAVIVVTENGTARCSIASDPSPPPLRAAKLVKTGAPFVVDDPRYRFLLFEFSESPLFPVGLHTVALAGTGGAVTLTRLAAMNVERAFRQGERGYVRVRGVTATNRLATSAAQPVRR